MSKSSNQKLKLLYIAKIFSMKTDEEHPITMSQIIEELRKYDISAERKSIYSDIELLRYFGMYIISERGNGVFNYYLGAREFEMAELKLLVDAVQSSKFITGKKSQELIGKLEALTSKYGAAKLQRHVLVADRVKTMNESIYYNVDYINEAINSNVMIDFEYYEWDISKKLVKRNNGDKKSISPWMLVWDDENYYLVAYDSVDSRIKHYRVDKIRNIIITNKARMGNEEFAKVNGASYSKKIFGMYGGKSENLTMEFENRLIGVVLDRFGSDIMIIPKEKDKFVIHINVEVSNQFFSWVIGLGYGVKILEPQSVVDQLVEVANGVLYQYQ